MRLRIHHEQCAEHDHVTDPCEYGDYGEPPRFREKRSRTLMDAAPTTACDERLRAYFERTRPL